MTDPADLPRRLGQLRHDVDDVYELLDATNEKLVAVADIQQRHSNRLDEIQRTLDLQTGRMGRVEGRLDGVEGRLDRIEHAQRQQGEKLDAILNLLRSDQPTSE